MSAWKGECAPFHVLNGPTARMARKRRNRDDEVLEDVDYGGGVADVRFRGSH